MQTKLKLWPYYGVQVFFQLLLWIPIFYDFQQKIGLAEVQIFEIQSWYYLFFVFFEIPTGNLSDRFGHKNCIKIGTFVLALANILPIASPDYWGMMTHFLCIALARALLSGAASAHIYDYLKEKGEEDRYKEIEGKARSYSLIARFVGWSLVGPLMQWSLYGPYALTALLTSVAFISSFKMGDIPLRKRDKNENELKAIFNVFKTTPSLVMVMFQGVGLFILVRICQVNLYQPILKSKDVDVTWFGILMAIMTVFEAFGAANAHRLIAWFDDRKGLLAMTGVLCLTFFGFSYGGQFLTTASFMLFSLAAGFAFPLQRHMMNHSLTDSRFRATVLSIESIFDRLFCAWVVSFVAGFVERGELNQYLVYSSVGIFFFTCLIFAGQTLANNRDSSEKLA